jgi:succinylarginine dihydrolase
MRRCAQPAPNNPGKSILPIAHEINFDSIVGPTHNYAGLAVGNIASKQNKGRISNPRAAALQGLAKMKLLADMGVRQAVLPPHPRPDITALRQLGFHGGDRQILAAAERTDPALLAACASSSAMWAANAATVTPSADAADGKVHFTPANLVSQLHRSLETPTTAVILRAIFADESVFAHHPPLPATSELADEGAANHLRLAAAHGRSGVEVFIYGRESAHSGTKQFPARQSLQASRTIARIHRVEDRSVFIRQNPIAIDAGAFHNDVVAIANLNVLLRHSAAWIDAKEPLSRIGRTLRADGIDLVDVQVSNRQVPLSDAIKSYLFNSQIVSLADGGMALIAPIECQRTPGTRRFLDQLISAGTPIRAVYFVDLRQSMRNGGGPACLRLRVVLTERELARVHPGVFLTDALYEKLTTWVQCHYRSRLSGEDLADPKLLEESRRALDELTQILRLGSIYDFQK